MLVLLIAHLAAALAAPSLVRLLRLRAFYVLATVPAAALVWALTRTEAIRDGRAVTESYPWAGQLDLHVDLRLTTLPWLMVLLVGSLGRAQRIGAHVIPGALKNAIDWASRPWGQNAFDHVPAAVIGASIGQIGTALAQQSLRAVLSFCNARQMTSPEAYVTYTPQVFPGDGVVTDEATRTFLATFMTEFRDHIVRVRTVLPRRHDAAESR